MSVTLVFNKKEYDAVCEDNSGYVFNPITGKFIGLDEKAELIEDFIIAAKRAIKVINAGRDIDANRSDLTENQYILAKCCSIILHEYDYYIEDRDSDSTLEFLDTNVFPVPSDIFDCSSGERDIQYFTDTTNTKMVLLSLLCGEECDAGILFNFYSEGA